MVARFLGRQLGVAKSTSFTALYSSSKVAITAKSIFKLLFKRYVDVFKELGKKILAKRQPCYARLFRKQLGEKAYSYEGEC
jgi:hypothetical protein